MQVTVRFFARLREVVGHPECTLELPDEARLEHLVAHLLAHYPVLDGQQQGWNFAINHNHAELDHALAPGDRVAIFPYIAGG